jgi:hypothetical protein
MVTISSYRRKNKMIKITDIGSSYNINHKEWILAEITVNGTYVLQHETIEGTYQTMKLTESEMNNVIRKCINYE